jgi:hypothetical protein
MRAGVVVLLLGLSGGAAAQAVDPADSARAILPGCKAWLAGSQADRAAQGLCIGRVGVVMYNADLAGGCPPRDLAPREAVQAMVAFMETVPARWDEGFVRLGAEGVAARWPCATRPRQ